MNALRFFADDPQTDVVLRCLKIVNVKHLNADERQADDEVTQGLRYKRDSFTDAEEHGDLIGKRKGKYGDDQTRTEADLHRRKQKLFQPRLIFSAYSTLAKESVAEPMAVTMHAGTILILL